MSRLEEMKDKYLKAIPFETINGINVITVDKKDLDYFIKQAERVQELDFENGQFSRRMDWKEEIYQERENGLKIIIELIKEDKEKLKQQNKRYRNALVKINDWDWETHKEVVEIARKALESESE